jgi:hypothetical protein
MMLGNGQVQMDFAAQKFRMRHVHPEVLVSEPNGRSRLTLRSFARLLFKGLLLTS